MTGGKVIHSNYRAVKNFCRYITYGIPVGSEQYTV